MRKNLKCYHWYALDHLQQKQHGTLIAESAKNAERQLIGRGLHRIRLSRNWQLSTKPTSAELCALLSQLAMMLNASLTLKSALGLLQESCLNIALYRWLDSLINQLESGASFSQALTQQGLYLNAQECQLIKVGEITGKLSDVCRQIAEHRQHILALQRKVHKILLYPAIVLAISVILTMLLLIFVVPQFAEMYGSSQNLPHFTQLLLTFSTFLQQYGFHLMMSAVIIAVLFHYGIQHSRRLQQWKISLIHHLPVFGEIKRTARLVNFCRNLALMLSAGIPLQQALQSFLLSAHLPQRVVQDPFLQHAISTMQIHLAQGYRLSQSVSSRFFPEQAQKMLNIGEKSGKTAEVLQHIGDTYQQRLEHQIDLLSQSLEPMLMLIIGTLIGLIMLGMYLPIFNMGAMIQ